MCSLVASLFGVVEAMLLHTTGLALPRPALPWDLQREDTSGSWKQLLFICLFSAGSLRRAVKAGH